MDPNGEFKECLPLVIVQYYFIGEEHDVVLLLMGTLKEQLHSSVQSIELFYISKKLVNPIYQVRLA